MDIVETSCMSTGQKSCIYNCCSKENQRKVKLLTWISKVLPQFQVTNFDTSWNDGIVLCALLNTVCPGICPHFNFLQPHNRVNNCRLGLQLVNDYLNIPTSLIAPEEIAIANNDGTANKIFRLAYMIKLTAQQQKWIPFNDCSDIPDKSIDRSSDTLVVSGSGYKHTTVGRKSQFTISRLQKFPTYLKIDILGPNVSDELSQKLVSLTVTDLQTDFYRQQTNRLSPSKPVSDYDSDGIFEKDDNVLETIPYDYKLSINGTCLVSYIPRKTGVHYISVQLHDTDIDGSPFRVIVTHPISSHPNSKALLLKSLSFDTPALWDNSRRLKVKKLRVIRRTLLPNKIKDNDNFLKSVTAVNNTDEEATSDSSQQFTEVNSVTSEGNPVSTSVVSNPSSESMVVNVSPDSNTSTYTAYTNSSSSSGTTSTVPVENIIQPNFLLNPGDENTNLMNIDIYSSNEFVTPSTSPGHFGKETEREYSENEEYSTYDYQSKDSEELARESVFREGIQTCSNAEKINRIKLGSARSAFNRVINSRSLPNSEKSSESSTAEVGLRATENNGDFCSSESNHSKVDRSTRDRSCRSFSYNSSFQHVTPKSLREERSIEVFNWLDNINSLTSDQSQHNSSRYLLQRSRSPLCRNIQMNQLVGRKRIIKNDGFNSSVECSSRSLFNDEKQTSGFYSPKNESRIRSLRMDKTFSVHSPTFSRLPCAKGEVPTWKNIATCCECHKLMSPQEIFYEDCPTQPNIWQKQQSRCKKCIYAFNVNQTCAGCPFYHQDGSKDNGEKFLSVDKNPNIHSCNTLSCLPCCGIHSRIASDPYLCSHMSNKSHSSSPSLERQLDQDKIFKSEVTIFLNNPQNKHNSRINHKGKCQSKNMSNCQNSLLVKKRKLLVLHNYNFDDKNEVLGSTADGGALTSTAYYSEANSDKGEDPTSILEKAAISNPNENTRTTEETSQCYVHNWLRDSVKAPTRQLTMETNDSGIAINSRSPSPQQTHVFHGKSAIKRKSVCDVTTIPFTKYSDFQKKECVSPFKYKDRFVEKSTAKQLDELSNLEEFDNFNQSRLEKMETNRENSGKHSMKYMASTIFRDLEEFLSSELYNGALLQALLNPSEIHEDSSVVDNDHSCNRVGEPMSQKYFTVPCEYHKWDDRSATYSGDFSPETSEKISFEKHHSAHRLSKSSEKSGLYWDDTLERRKSDTPQFRPHQDYYSDNFTSNKPSSVYRGSSTRQYQSYSHGLNELPLTDVEEELHISDRFGDQTCTPVSSAAEQNVYCQYLERSDATNISSLADVEELTSICEPPLEELLKCPVCNCCSNPVNGSRKLYNTNKKETCEIHMLNDSFEEGNIQTTNTEDVQEQCNTLPGDYTLSDTSLPQWYIDESELSQSSDWLPSSISMATHELLSPSMESLFTSLHKAIAATEERPDNVCYALGPGLEFGYVKTLNFFQVRTVNGCGPLTVGIQSPYPGNTVEEISIIYTDHCTYDVSYYVTKTGCYTVDIKWAGRHIFQSPFFCQVLPLTE